ncbi:MAG: MCP four helix bundle domain-containing protein, partial [Rhodoferax sp.]|nr:MCP four helix bundle domain-containing protein [Rhodoferax sp.]
MNFRAKILLSPVIAVILMLLLGVVAFLGIRSVQSNLDQLANVNMQRLIQANDARDELLVVNTDVFKLFTWMANFDEARIQNETAVINTRIDGAVKKFEDMSKGIAEEEEKKNLQAVEAGLRKYQKAIGAAIDMATGDVTSGAGMAQAATKIFDGISKQVDQIVDAQKKEAATTLEQTRSDSSRTIVLSLILVALATGGSLFIAWWVTRDVMQQLGGEPDVAADIASRIAAGDLSRTFDIKSGDSSSLMAAMKTMNDTLKGVLADTDTLVKAAAVGDLTTRVDASKHQGDFRKLVQGVNDTVKNIAEPMQITSNYIDQIAKGIIPAQITTAYQGEYLVIRNNLNGLIKMMGDLQSETNILIQGAAVGELNKRANADLFQGGWKQLMEGVNDTVKNIAEPLKLTSSYIDQIAKGIIPAQITNADQGEYLVIRNNLNGLIKMMGDLLEETGTLIQGAADGDLNKRANAAQFQGGWNELVAGVNQIIDGIVLPVNEAVAVLSEMEKGDLTQTVNGNYKGQLNDFKNTVNNTIAKLSQVINEVNGAASSIASASEQVSSTAQSMSQATSEQAA